MGLCTAGGNINWFPGHLTAATRALRDRLKLTDLVIEVRNACDMVTEVQRVLYTSLSESNGNLESEDDLEKLIHQQFEMLQKALKIPHKASEARTAVSKRFLTLFRTGKLGPFILDNIPGTPDSVS